MVPVLQFLLLQPPKMHSIGAHLSRTNRDKLSVSSDDPGETSPIRYSLAVYVSAVIYQKLSATEDYIKILVFC